MSLATRCTSCGTVFRVVQDQLRVSSGWVRCGRCSEVFNAIESLVDLELDLPGGGASPVVQGTRTLEDAVRVSGSPEAVPAGLPPAPDSSQFAATEVPADVFAEPPPSAEVAEPLPSMTPSASVPMPADFSALSDEPPPPAPEFVRRADRAARWRSPGARAALSALVLAALAGLAWQVHLSHHDWLAARWPALRPAVERLCGLSGCTLEPLRRIESLMVESSGLVRVGAAGLYRLSVVLRNRDQLALRVPAIDLSLTDSQGRVVVRRVLQAAEIGVAVTAIEPGAELALSATLRVIDMPVVGYTIEIFYP